MEPEAIEIIKVSDPKDSNNKENNWKATAKERLKNYYLVFAGSPWNEYEISTEGEKLLLAKICFAFYGKPTNADAKDITDAYQKTQLEFGKKILKLLLEANNKDQKRILIDIIFIYCKADPDEFVLPVFSVFTGDDSNKKLTTRKYVDTQMRIYNDWNDWLENNTLPEMEYAYPGRGFFTSSLDCEYEFDPDKEPDIQFGKSPCLRNKLNWIANAKMTLKHYYLSFKGSQWDKYEIGTEDEKFLLAKICFAFYGNPTIADAEDIKDAYQKEQLEFGDKILKLLLKANKKDQKHILVGIIFVCCRNDPDVSVLPVFSVFTGDDPEKELTTRKYVDSQMRIYNDWNDWLENNTLPEMEYAYPCRGFFTSSLDCEYEFDPDKEPDIQFGKSPACSLGKKILGYADTYTGFAALACGLVGVVGLFTPLLPMIATGVMYGGSLSTLYGSGRAINRLWDKGNHGENLLDSESITLYFSIAATPFHFITSATNAALVKGATENGRIFSNSTRLFATILNFTTLGVDSVLLGFGIANLIEKRNQNKLTKLDLLQFSMSVFFFTNTLIQPKMASTIISQAQDSHIQNYANQLSDAETKASFDKFLEQNKVTGTIRDKSRIVRTINKIEDPNRLFGQLNGADNIKIGGRKGRSLIAQKDEQSIRVSTKNSHQTDIKFKTITEPPKIGNHVQKCLNKVSSESKLFKNLNDRQTNRVNKTIGVTAKKNEQIVQKAMEISKEMYFTNVDDTISMVEIVCTELENKFPNVDIANVGPMELKQIDTIDFRQQIQKDYLQANKIAASKNLNFPSDLEAVYHYRKHGSDFFKNLNNQKIEVYLKTIPNNLINDDNLISIQHTTTPNETFVTRLYRLPNNDFGVTVQDSNGNSIRSMYNLPNSLNNNQPISPIDPNFHAQLMENIQQLVQKQYSNLLTNIPIFINFEKPEQRFCYN